MTRSHICPGKSWLFRATGSAQSCAPHMRCVYNCPDMWGLELQSPALGSDKSQHQHHQGRDWVIAESDAEVMISDYMIQSEVCRDHSEHYTASVRLWCIDVKQWRGIEGFCDIRNLDDNNDCFHVFMVIWLLKIKAEITTFLNDNLQYQLIF